MITSKQRAALRSLANSEETIFQVGKGGISENLIKQVEDALTARELIKIRVLETAMVSAREVCTILCEKTGAEPVQCIGSKLVIFRRNEKEPRIIIE